MVKPDLEIFAISIDTAMVYMGSISRRKVLQLIERGSIKSKKLGARRIILKRSVDEYLAGLPEELAA